jgi:hypothetical protein
MSEFSDYLEAQILRLTLKAQIGDDAAGVGSAYTPQVPHLGLFTTNPGEEGNGSEVYWGSAPTEEVPFRRSITFGVVTAADSASGTTTTTSATNSGPVVFPEFNAISNNIGQDGAATEVTITHMGIFDSPVNGNLLYYTNLTVTKTLSATDVLNFNNGSITVTLD